MLLFKSFLSLFSLLVSIELFATSVAFAEPDPPTPRRLKQTTRDAIVKRKALVARGGARRHGPSAVPYPICAGSGDAATGTLFAVYYNYVIYGLSAQSDGYDIDECIGYCNDQGSCTAVSVDRTYDYTCDPASGSDDLTVHGSTQWDTAILGGCAESAANYPANAGAACCDYYESGQD